MGFAPVVLRWGRSWASIVRGLPWVMFLGIGFANTVFSEHVNVHLAHRWAYSRWMPTIGGIGLVPLMQWLVVPTLSVRLVRRPLRRQHRKLPERDVHRAILGSFRSARPGAE